MKFFRLMLSLHHHSHSPGVNPSAQRPSQSGSTKNRQTDQHLAHQHQFMVEHPLTGVPYPVTGSQPFAAGNPAPSHPIALPLSTSVKASNPFLYSHGFRNPSDGFPAARSASLTNANIAEAVGVDALVPSKPANRPFQTVMYDWLWAEISGYARPDVLYKPLNCVPRVWR